MNSSKIIVALEGIPGAGKTTIMEKLRHSYRTFDGIDQILPKNLPNESITLSKILESDLLKTSSIKESPALVVILDRYYQSTLAYHWAYDKVYSDKKYNTVQSWKQKKLEAGALIVPDYTFFIDISPAMSGQRKNRKIINHGSNEWVRDDFLYQMRRYYMNLITHDKNENCILIDGRGTIEEVIRTILNTINFRPKDLDGKK